MASIELLQAGTVWQLLDPLNGYSRPSGSALATQLWSGRTLQVLTAPGPGPGSRLRARLLDDGYPCWIDTRDLLGRATCSQAPRPQLLNSSAIARRIDAVLAFASATLEQPNTYLWGGTLGPDYDCSGLVQRAFASAGIWLPRDAYLQERFCMPVAVRPGQIQLLEPGDLIFFGRPQRCTHVGLHLGGGRYLHSSGREHGRNGLGIDDLNPRNSHPVASHYRGELRGAGRVMRCHDGSPLPA